MLNKVELIGHVGKDAEVSRLPNGNAVCNVSLATTEKWRDDHGDLQEHTEWHRLSYFGKQAENAGTYLKKGARIFTEGKIRTNKYQDKDGVDKYSTEIRCDYFLLLDRKSSDGTEKPDAASSDAQTPAKKPVKNAQPH